MKVKCGFQTLEQRLLNIYHYNLQIIYTYKLCFSVRKFNESHTLFLHYIIIPRSADDLSYHSTGLTQPIWSSMCYTNEF